MRASCTCPRAPASRSSRRTGAASPRTTGPGSWSATRSSTCGGTARTSSSTSATLEEALIRTVGAFGLEGERLEGDNMTGVWLLSPPRKIASIGVACLQVGHDARLRAQRRPRPGAVHGVDHSLRARRRRVHDHRPRARPAGHRRGGRSARGRRARGGARPHTRAAGRARGRPVAAARARAARRQGVGESRTRRPSPADCLLADLARPGLRLAVRQADRVAEDVLVVRRPVQARTGWCCGCPTRSDGPLRSSEW